MTVSIGALENAIDVIARRCPRGLSAILGECPPPSHEEMATAATWRPSVERVGGPGSKEPDDYYVDTVTRVLTITDPIESIGWEKIIAAANEVRDFYPEQFEVYRLHVLHVSEGEPGRWQSTKKIAERAGVGVATVARWRHLIPRRIAKAALK